MKSLAELGELDRGQRAVEFVTLAKYLLRAPRSPSEAYDLAQAERAPERVQRILKAAVGAGSLHDPASAPLVDLQIVSSAFIAALRNQGVFDRLLSDMRRVPLATPGIRVTTTALTGYGVAEGAAKPITKLDMTATGLDKLKADCIIVMSDEMADSASAAATALLSRELRAGVVAATDGTFLAGLAAGVAALPSAGATAVNILADIEDMLEAVESGAGSRFFLIVGPTTAKHLSVKSTTTGRRAFEQMGPLGGTIAGVDVLVSDNLPAVGSPQIIAALIDTAGIAADTSVIAVDQARHASLEMVDSSSQTSSAAGSPQTPVAAQMVSLWQTNSRGLRASRYFGFKKLRANAVQVLTGSGCLAA